MSSVELSLQLQIQDIAAVQQAYVAAVLGRDPNTLWWLVDSAENIVYENRVKGSSLSAVDASITNVKIGSTIFGDWFNLHNSYFSQDQPIPGVQSLKQAIETQYRWRVPQYFNDVARTGGSTISPQYVFPYPDFNVGIYVVTGTTAGTYTKGVGPVDLTVAGPGILALTPLTALGSPVTMALTAVYPDGTTGPISGSVSGGPGPADSVVLGETDVSAANSTTGVVSVANTTLFRVGTGGKQNLVVIAEEIAGSAPPSWTTEVAEVMGVALNTSLTLRQPTPPGASTPFSPGLRNTYTSAAKVYPLFIDVNSVTNSTGTADDEVQIGFYPDWPQGFVDVTSISTPQ